jgi:uncharacterized protein
MPGESGTTPLSTTAGPAGRAAIGRPDVRSRRIHVRDDRPSWVVVFDKGEDALTGLGELAADNGLSAASLTGVGAFASATIGYFERDLKDYLRILVDQQVEVLSMIGDIALVDEVPAVHCHVVLGCRDGSTRGGHLLRCDVWPTLEMVITEYPASLRKRIDPESGLALIDL